MSFPSGLTITNRGRTLQAKAIAGAQLNFTKIQIGNGNLSGQLPSEMQALVSVKMTLDITRLQILSGGKALVGTQFNNSGLVSGFYFREIGVFANDPDLGEILYCYGNAGDAAEYIPADQGGAVIEKFISTINVIGNAANVSAVIDQSLVFVTLQEFQEFEELACKITISETEPEQPHAGNLWLQT